MTDKKRYIATMDIETSDGLKGSEFLVGGFCYEYYGRLRAYTFFNKEEFFKFILEDLKETKILCYVHNEDFDLWLLTEIYNENAWIKDSYRGQQRHGRGFRGEDSKQLVKLYIF